MFNQEISSSPRGNLGRYTLFEAPDFKSATGKEPQSDHPPKDSEVNVGAINPYALVEAVLGHKLDRSSMNVARIISDVLQTDYHELFDMKHSSVLYVGLELNEKERRAEELNREDVKILRGQDFQTTDLSVVQKLGDLEQIGLKDLNQTKVQMARLQNGKLHVVLDVRSITRTVSNRNITRTLNEIASPFRVEDERSWGVPPNCAWRSIETVFQDYSTQRLLSDFSNRFRLGFQDANNMNMFTDRKNGWHFDNPVQGATGNSWLIAAMFSVFWSDPGAIHALFRGDALKDPNNRDSGDTRNPLLHNIKFYDKGGRNNAETRTVEVDYKVPINKTSNEPVYCRASGGTDYWPALYEKAFAMWITKSNSDRPDITQTAHGDPIKAMAQIDGREPEYFFTEKHDDLVRYVRFCSVNFKTTSPMCAYTYASGNMFRGSNLVANHAYSVLGWSAYGDRQYIIIRNPWGVTEPRGLTSYPGLLDQVEPTFWPPACYLESEGVMAVEENAFREYFACIGRTK